MYSLMNKEELEEMFPILKSKETAVLNMVTSDGISVASVFHAMKSLHPQMAESIKKNSIAGELGAGKLLMRKTQNYFILTMPIQESWKTGYDIDYLHQGFLKISSIYKEKNIESIAIQEGIIPNDVIEKFVETLDLPNIVYYKET